MGLDNGVYAKGIKKELIPSFVHPFFVELNEDKEEVELCYWRKCWNIRNDILNVIKGRSKDEVEYNLDANDIADICNVIEHYFDSHYYSLNDDSIWGFEELMPQNVTCYINLRWLHDYMLGHPEVECWFYDSY